MNTRSKLEHHATQLGLTQEDPKPTPRAKAPVATSDKILLGLGCVALAFGSATLSVWMVVPTLALTSAASVLLVRHLNAANALPNGVRLWSEFKSGGETVKRMMEVEQERSDSWNSDTSLNPMFRTSLSNISYDDHHRE